MSAHPARGEPFNPTARWRGRAYIGSGWAAFHGIAGDNRPHAHHAVQVVVTFGAPVTLWTSPAGAQPLSAALIPSDLKHALVPSDIEVGLLFIDAESARGRSLNSMSHGIWSPLIADVPKMRDAFELAIGGNERGLDLLLAQFAVQIPASHADVRVARVLERLHLSEHLDVTADEVAAWAHLSASRFAHRFRRHTGMPLRPYLRWLRLQRAAAAMINGTTATDAAHAAGFSDAAHLTRTLRTHFGIAPRVLTRLTGQ